MKTKTLLIVTALLSATAVLGAGPGSAPTPGTLNEQFKKEDDYDRLDGKGKSGKRVDVIEWSGNLEVHVYPKGSLAGLALKLDRPEEGKLVMVIGYRFVESTKDQLIRRAILGVPFHEGFHAYKDTSAKDYDKIIISNNTLKEKHLRDFELDPAPKELYPEGHPKRGPQTADDKPAPKRETASENKDGRSYEDINSFKW